MQLFSKRGNIQTLELMSQSDSLKLLDDWFRIDKLPKVPNNWFINLINRLY